MCDPTDELSRADRETLQSISEIWSEIEGLPVGTIPGVLDEFRWKVADAIYRSPPDVKSAERYTAIALLLLEGLI